MFNTIITVILTLLVLNPKQVLWSYLKEDCLTIEHYQSYPEYCMQIFYEEAGVSDYIDYSELLAVSWCESLWRKDVPGDRHLEETSDGLMQIRWDSKRFYLEPFGFTEESRTDPIQAIQMTERISKYTLYIYYMQGSKDFSWESALEFSSNREFYDTIVKDFGFIPAKDKWLSWSCRHRLNNDRRTSYLTHNPRLQEPYYISRQSLFDAVFRNKR